MIGVRLSAWNDLGTQLGVGREHALPAPIGGTFFALATGALSTLLPSAPGYIGTFDFFTMQGLMAYGVTREHATGFALLVHAVLWLPLTAIGSLCFLSFGNRKNSRDVESRRKNSLSRE